MPTLGGHAPRIHTNMANQGEQSHIDASSHFIGNCKTIPGPFFSGGVCRSDVGTRSRKSYTRWFRGFERCIAWSYDCMQQFYMPLDVRRMKHPSCHFCWALAGASHRQAQRWVRLVSAMALLRACQKGRRAAQPEGT